MTHNIFQGDAHWPFHLSVGVVAVDEHGRIGVHHFKERFGLSNVYTLVSETVEGNETLQAAALRGLREEFGAEAKIVGYLGSQTSNFSVDDLVIHKSTEYLVADVVRWDVDHRDHADNTRTSSIEWYETPELTRILQEQCHRLADLSINEAGVIGRYVQCMNRRPRA